MGYYSFYRIIKDILQTIFGRKFYRFLIIICITFLSFLIINKKTVFGADFTIGTETENGNYINLNFDVEYGGKTVNFEYHILRSFIPSATKQIVIYPYTANNINYIDLAFCYSTLIQSGITYKLDYSNSSENYYYYKRLQVPTLVDNSNKVVFWANSNNSFTTTNYSRTNLANVIISNNNLVYSSRDIYNTNNELVFDAPYNIPPKKVPEVATSLEDLEELNFDVISVDGWDYSNEDFYLLVYDRNYTETESLNNLYPKKEFLLNSSSPYYMQELTSDPSVNKIFWIPKGELGLDWKVGGTYGFRFAIRESIESEFSDWAYSYLDDEIQFTLSETVPETVIATFNTATEETKEDDQFNELNNNLKEQKEQDATFYNELLSDEYDEELPSDTLSGISSSSEDISDTQYIGLFSAIFGRFSDIINGDYSEVEEIHYPIMNTNKDIVLTSDILSSKIQNTFIYVLLQSFWMFLFGTYIFKFCWNLIRKIKDGSILHGYENSNEVITSTML